MRTSYPSNLSNREWETLQRYLPPLPKRGRPPIHSPRAIFDAIFYVLRTGCPWRYLPANFPPWQPFSIISGACALKESGRSCCGPFTGPNANGKEGTRIEVAPFWMRHPCENR
jgi:transposase